MKGSGTGFCHGTFSGCRFTRFHQALSQAENTVGVPGEVPVVGDKDEGVARFPVGGEKKFLNLRAGFTIKIAGNLNYVESLVTTPTTAQT